MTTLRPDYQWEAIPNRAVGYHKARPDAADPANAGADGAEKDKEVIVRSTDTDVSWKLAGGGWISTSEDMALFGLGMLSGKLIDAPTREAMWTAQKTSDGKVTPYGLGFYVGSRDGRPFARHSGSQEKTATMLVLLPG
jgi:CubicO group peptidase (beta-lactamase class C family)